MSDMFEFKDQDYFSAHSDSAVPAGELFSQMIDRCVGNGEFRAMVRDLWDQFSVAPASSRLSFHGCFVGGLLVHSVNLTLHMIKNCYANRRYLTMDDESVVLVGLGHDIGKAGLKEIPYYVPETSTWHKNKLGRLYNRNDKLSFFEEVDTTLYLFNNYGVKLCQSEYQAIRYHNMAFEDGFKMTRVSNNIFPLTLLLHSADMYSARICKT